MQQGGGAAQLLAFPLTRHPVGVDDDVVHGESRSVLGQHVQMTLDGEPGGLPRLGHQVEHQGAPRGRRPQRRRQLGHQHVRDHAGEPRAGAQHHQVGGHDGVDGLPGGRGVVRQQPHPAHLARGGRDRHLAADHPEHPRVAFQAGHVGLDLQGDRAHRQHPALDAQDAPELVEGGHRIGQHLRQASQHQIADRMPRQSAAATEPVLQDGRPQTPMWTVRSQGRQRHSQVAGRHHAEFAAQPARGSAVVGDRHHGGDVGGETPGRRQGRVQAVSAAQRDDAPVERLAHSRPRSRCSTRTDSW